ncbi:hypothetical protein GS504_01670 [Rhodococcus hoagii]|nr:hypothetical protein [Prescottella equi]NKS71620.1 hypothetical protein [Prescottella equi]
MIATRPRIAAAGIAASALLLGACSSNDTPESDGPTTSASTPDAAAREQVTALVNTYFQDLSRVQTNPVGNSALIDQVAAEPHASEIRNLTQKLSNAQYRASGQLDVDHLTIDSVTLPAAGESGATAKVDACYNPGGVVYTRPDGSNSPALEGRLDLANARLTLVNTSYPDPAGWRVSGFDGDGTRPCVG